MEWKITTECSIAWIPTLCYKNYLPLQLNQSFHDLRFETPINYTSIHHKACSKKHSHQFFAINYLLLKVTGTCYKTFVSVTSVNHQWHNTSWSLVKHEQTQEEEPQKHNHTHRGISHNFLVQIPLWSLTVNFFCFFWKIFFRICYYLNYCWRISVTCNWCLSLMTTYNIEWMLFFSLQIFARHWTLCEKKFNPDGATRSHWIIHVRKLSKETLCTCVCSGLWTQFKPEQWGINCQHFLEYSWI